MVNNLINFSIQFLSLVLTGDGQSINFVQPIQLLFYWSPGPLQTLPGSTSWRYSSWLPQPFKTNNLHLFMIHLLSLVLTSNGQSINCVQPSLLAVLGGMVVFASQKMRPTASCLFLSPWTLSTIQPSVRWSKMLCPACRMDVQIQQY